MIGRLSLKAVCPLRLWQKEGGYIKVWAPETRGALEPATGKEAYAVVQLRQDNARAPFLTWWVFRPDLNGPNKGEYLD